MPAFVRRFTQFPTIETLLEIEALNIVDTPPPFPTSGVGTGTLLQTAEFEDGPFAAGGDATLWDGVTKGTGPQEVFSAEDKRQRYGNFGFTRGTLAHQDPAARRHLAEFWNGNGFIYGKFIRSNRSILARVDTSVGEVAFSRLACITGDAGTYNLEPGDTFSVTTDTGGPAASDVLAAVAATVVGGVGTFPTLFVGGEQITIAIDGGPAITVTFSAADQLAVDVVARINATLGFTSAVIAAAFDINGQQRGTGGQVILADITVGTLVQIGHVAGTTNGTGNVANVDAVTTAEIVTIVNGSAALIAIAASALQTQSGQIRICSDTASSGTVLVVSGTMATELGLTPVDTTVSAGIHLGGTIPAGTRVTDTITSYLTLQTLTVPAGTAAALQGGPFLVKVRPILDDGTALGALAAAVTTVTDQPDFGAMTVTNPQALTVALTEGQMDVAYEAALNATIDLNSVVREATFSVSARHSDVVRAAVRQNALDASEQGHFGRKAIVSAPVGFTQTQAIAQVATLRSDRLFYTWPAWQVRIPEIALLGLAGGIGFTDTGNITVRADHSLGTVDAQLAPEENPGQATGLIEAFFDIETQPAPLGITAYTALRAAGICAPRVTRTAGSFFQSGITSVAPLTDPGLVTQARRKMADFVQDTLAVAILPFAKKLNKQSRRDAIRGIIEQFLSSLLRTDNPELSRIVSFSVDQESGNTPETLAQGIFVVIIKVRTLSSLDAITLNTEIGEGVVTIQEAA